MGGIGSGRYYRNSTKVAIEQTNRIDVRYMRREVLLRSGVSGTLSWSVGGKSKSSISFKCTDRCLFVKFQHRLSGGEWKAIEQCILFEFTPCHFGGYRTWFQCPGCRKRVGVLCGYGELFLCRHCYRLPYRSKSENRRGRLLLKKHKLGERIFETYEQGTGWQKKKGMHQKTFNPLYKQYKQLEELINYS